MGILASYKHSDHKRRDGATGVREGVRGTAGGCPEASSFWGLMTTLQGQREDEGKSETGCQAEDGGKGRQTVPAF